MIQHLPFLYFHIVETKGSWSFGAAFILKLNLHDKIKIGHLNATWY